MTPIECEVTNQRQESPAPPQTETANRDVKDPSARTNGSQTHSKGTTLTILHTAIK